MKQFILSLAALLAAASSYAQVTVREPWIRATVPQQRTTGIFMQLKSARDVKLVVARTPVAKTVEIHEMMMREGMMHMRSLESLPLPAGKDVALQPGSFHLMLLDLKEQVHAGSRVPVTLVFEDKDGRRETVEIEATARVLNSVGH
jgi:hypothetical protein